jgi:hypothetical protein
MKVAIVKAPNLGLSCNALFLISEFGIEARSIADQTARTKSEIAESPKPRDSITTGYAGPIDMCPAAIGAFNLRSHSPSAKIIFTNLAIFIVDCCSHY